MKATATVFNVDDGGRKFLWNICKFLPYCMVPHLKTLQSPNLCVLVPLNVLYYY